MKIEHIAFNVESPVDIAAWYVEHLQLTVIQHYPESNQMHFLSDDSGTVIEIYSNPEAEVPNYREQNPLIVHLAFESSDPTLDSKRLIAAGAEFVGEKKVNADTYLIMLRDPWGLALQLCKRRPSFF